MSGQVPVPHIERVQCATLTPESRARRRLQQRRALTQNFVVIGPHSGHPRSTHRRQIVEVAPSIRRVSANQRQVLGREQHRAQHPEDLARAAHRRAIQPCLVGPAGRDLQVNRTFTTIVDHDRRHHRPRRADTHQRRVRRDPMRPQRRRIPQRFNEIRLAVAVAARRTPSGPVSVRAQRAPRTGNPASPDDGRTPNR